MRRGTLLGGAVCLAAVVGLGVAVAHGSPAGPHYSSHDVLAGKSLYQQPGPPVYKLKPPTEPKLLVIGDSYTQGYAATDEAVNGFAPVAGRTLGWPTETVFSSGSGWLKAGPDGKTMTDLVGELPGQQAFMPNVIIVQGGLNDQQSQSDLVHAAVIAGVRRIEQVFPDAKVVLFGPVNPKPDVSGFTRATADVDAVWYDASLVLKVPYISPAREGWITARNEAAMITSSDHVHPGTEGHAYIAQRLVADLRKLST